jgi:hypothetical protein
MDSSTKRLAVIRQGSVRLPPATLGIYQVRDAAVEEIDSGRMLSAEPEVAELQRRELAAEQLKASTHPAIMPELRQIPGQARRVGTRLPALLPPQAQLTRPGRVHADRSLAWPTQTTISGSRPPMTLARLGR